ncbi:MAG: hypothetical protein ISS32_00930 [Candidatus Omnitrophica bacterium]|nr:hypothetical protein [Candidatus Omnitrophota bacterium]MBL7210331.1 hypothetical protein [Candidatus Omnitrophota bacterium]
MKKLLAGIMMLGLLLASSPLFAQVEVGKGLPEEQLKAVAIKAMQDADIVLEDVEIIYDEENALWEERVMMIEEMPSDPNHGNLPGGILVEKKYQVVFFDFAEESPTKDVWVFVDQDTGEVITVYQEK